MVSNVLEEYISSNFGVDILNLRKKAHSYFGRYFVEKFTFGHILCVCNMTAAADGVCCSRRVPEQGGMRERCGAAQVQPERAHRSVFRQLRTDGVWEHPVPAAPGSTRREWVARSYPRSEISNVTFPLLMFIVWNVNVHLGFTFFSCILYCSR